MNKPMKFAFSVILSGLISTPAFAATAAEIVSGKMAGQYQLINEKTTGYASCAKEVRLDISSTDAEVKLIAINSGAEKEIRTWKASGLALAETKNSNSVTTETVLGPLEVKTLEHVDSGNEQHTVARGISYNESKDQLLYKKALENSYMAVENQFKCFYGRK